MDPLQNGGAIDLGGQRGISVKEIQLVPAALLDALPGDMAVEGAIGHLRVVNIAAGVAWLIPADPRFATTLRDQLTELIDTHVCQDPAPGSTPKGT